PNPPSPARSASARGGGLGIDLGRVSGAKDPDVPVGHAIGRLGLGGGARVEAAGRRPRPSRSGLGSAASVAKASPASSAPQPNRPAAKPGTYSVPQWIGIAMRAPTSLAASTALDGSSPAGAPGG